MKLTSDETIFSMELQTVGNFAIDDTQLHTGGNLFRPDNRKSLAERHQTTDWLDCN